MSNDSLEFDLVMRSAVEIGAPPRAVWAALGRLEAWKSSVALVERIAGEPDAIGEVLRVRQRAGEAIVYVTHRTIACERPSWKVQWLETEDGRSTRGYLVYSLAARDGGTDLVGQLLARAALPRGTRPDLSDERASRIICEATQAKFHADHVVLKRLVEEEKR
jgi:hypothetical protein